MKLVMVFMLLCALAAAYAFGQGKKADPCAGASTQFDLNECWGREYKAADATLNQVYRQLVSKLDDEEKAQLKAVESAWLKYRDANCEFVADEYKGGTMRPMAYAICLTDMTKNRVGELRIQVKDRDR